MKKLEFVNRYAIISNKQSRSENNNSNISPQPNDSISIGNINVTSTTNYTAPTHNQKINISKLSAEKLINFDRVKATCKNIISRIDDDDFIQMIGEATLAFNGLDQLSELWHWLYEKRNMKYNQKNRILTFEADKEILYNIVYDIQNKIDKKLILNNKEVISKINFKNNESETIFAKIVSTHKNRIKCREFSDSKEKFHNQFKSQFTVALIAFDNGNFDLASSSIKNFLNSFETACKFDIERIPAYIEKLVSAIDLLNYDHKSFYVNKFQEFLDDKNEYVNVIYAVRTILMHANDYEFNIAEPYLQKLENFYRNANINQQLKILMSSAFGAFAEKALAYGNISQAQEYHYKSWEICIDNNLIIKDKYNQNLNHKCMLNEENTHHGDGLNEYFYLATQKLIFCATVNKSHYQKILDYFAGSDIGDLLNNICALSFNLPLENVVSIKNINKENIPPQLQLFLSMEKIDKKLIKSIPKLVKDQSMPVESAITILIDSDKIDDARDLFNKIPKEQVEKDIKLLQQGIYLASNKKNLFHTIESYDLAPQPKSLLHYKAAEKFLSKTGKALKHIDRAIELFPCDESYQLLK